jgi:internalin A
MLSDASPLIIVRNEKQDRKRDIGLTQLRARFPNLRGSYATNLEMNRGLDEVIASIRRELESLPQIGFGLPATWKRVRKALEQDSRDHIGLDQYITICQENGLHAVRTNSN